MEPGRLTCLICLKNNHESGDLQFFDMATVVWENTTYLNKLEFVLNAEIVVYDSTSICNNCLYDLNNAYDFKEKVTKALEYWTAKFEETINIAKETEVIDILNDGMTINTEVVEAPLTTEITDVTVVEVGPSLCTLEPSIEQITVTNNDNNPEETSQFQCYKCNEVIIASELINHDCSIDNNTKIEKESLSDTKPVEEDSKLEKYPCSLCKSVFNSRYKLGKHRRSKHNSLIITGKKYSCSYCSRAFKQSYHLKEHLTSHTGEHNFTCDVCGKTFQRLSSQRRHMRTHEAPPGEKSKKTPFLCNICGKKFPYSNGAQRHMRIHSGDRRYECKFCSKKFSQSTHLKVHLRTHTGEKPYMCTICGGSYTLKATLDKHVKGHMQSKDDINILHNLEPNLSRVDSTEEEDDVKTEDYLIRELYDP